MLRLARLTARVPNPCILSFHSHRTLVWSGRSDDSKEQNVSNHETRSAKSSLQLAYPLGRKLLRNTSLQFNQVRFKSTGKLEALRSSLKQSDETEIDLSNFQIPNLPTQEEIEAMSKIVSAIDLGLTPWLPTGLLFNFFDYVHKHGVEWPVTIIVATIIIRTAIVPLQISSRKYAFKVGDEMSRYQSFQEEIERVQMSGNMMEMNKVAMKYQDLLSSSGRAAFQNMKKWEMFKMPLAQFFLFTSFFLTLRKMCYYPIASLENSEFLWLPSLAHKDPFYLLPIITSATLFATLRLGIDTGTMGLTNATTMQKFMIFTLPVGSLIFTCSFPSALCLYWCTANFHALLTASILKIEPVRKYFDIPKPPAKDVDTSQSSIWRFQDAIENGKKMLKKGRIKKNLNNMQSADLSKFRNAGKGPIRKTYKYDPTKMKV